MSRWASGRTRSSTAMTRPSVSSALGSVLHEPHPQQAWPAPQRSSCALRLPRGIRDPLLRRTAQAMSSLPGRSPHVIVKSIYAHFYADVISHYDPGGRDSTPPSTISSWIELGVQGSTSSIAGREERYLEPFGISGPANASVTQRTAAGSASSHRPHDHVDHHPMVSSPMRTCAWIQVRIGRSAISWLDVE